MYTNGKSIKMIHTGDLHLGFSYSGLKEKSAERQRDNFETFLYITSLCQSRNIDILLIAGDLFDTPKPDRELLKAVRKAFSDITDTLVVISPGNHDYYEIDGIYDDIEAWSDNVYIFHGEMDCFEFNIRDVNVRIYGAAFTGQYQRESLMKQRRLNGDSVVSIGLFHGELGSTGSASGYNRITVGQIEENRFSYLALGHLHSTEGIFYAGRVPYAYCGSPEGHGFDETGEKGIYLGSISGEECNMEFLRTCRRQYVVEKICIETFESAKQLSGYLLDFLRKKYGEEYKEYLYQIRFYGNNRQDIDLNRIKFYLKSLYYIEVKNETDGSLIDCSSNTRMNPGSVQTKDRGAQHTSLETYYAERMQRLITTEESDGDEIKAERYRRALQLGMEAIRRHTGC